MENSKTKSGKTILIIVLLLIIGGGVVAMFIHEQKRSDEMREYVDSLYKQSRETITFDSIRSVIDRRLTDSIRSIRAEIETERYTRRRETQRIRRETEKLRHRLDSIGPIDRPEF